MISSVIDRINIELEAQSITDLFKSVDTDPSTVERCYFGRSNESGLKVDYSSKPVLKHNVKLGTPDVVSDVSGDITYQHKFELIYHPDEGNYVPLLDILVDTAGKIFEVQERDYDTDKYQNPIDIGDIVIGGDFLPTFQALIEAHKSNAPILKSKE